MIRSQKDLKLGLLLRSSKCFCKANVPVLLSTDPIQAPAPTLQRKSSLSMKKRNLFQNHSTASRKLEFSLSFLVFVSRCAVWILALEPPRFALSIMEVFWTKSSSVLFIARCLDPDPLSRPTPFDRSCNAACDSRDRCGLQQAQVLLREGLGGCAHCCCLF
jgi:hypothetical protein